MKRILSLLITATMSAFMTGCYTNVIEINDDDNNGNNKELIILDRSQLDQHIFAESHICEVTFTTEVGWYVNDMADEQMKKWIYVSPSRSDNGGSMYTISIFVDENTTGQGREAVFHLVSGSEEETIVINQSFERSDGMVTPPYDADVYTDIIEKISFQDYSDNGEIASDASEWMFICNNPGQYAVDYMGLSRLAPEGETIEQQITINNDNRVITHDRYGWLMPDGRWDIINRHFIEPSVNDYHFITHQQLRELDYQNGENPEPTLQEINYRYSNYRRISALPEGQHTVSEYVWIDGNMIEEKEVQPTNGESRTLYTFTYRTESNDKTNVDLNAFLSGDMYAAAGLYGKRSTNLLSSITDSKGGVSNFEYLFDEQGRITTITRRCSSGGSVETRYTVFTVHYLGSIPYDGTQKKS